ILLKPEMSKDVLTFDLGESKTALTTRPEPKPQWLGMEVERKMNSKLLGLGYTKSPLTEELTGMIEIDTPLTMKKLNERHSKLSSLPLEPMLILLTPEMADRTSVV